jgi:hypothetical protein
VPQGRDPTGQACLVAPTSILAGKPCLLPLQNDDVVIASINQ